MLTLILIGLVAWSAALLFMAWHIWISPEGYEDESGFHIVKAKTVSRWRHVQVHHPRRDHRHPRPTFAMAVAAHRRHGH